MDHEPKLREEQDSLGTLQIPDEVYYGIMTERVRKNFGRITGWNLSEHLPHYLYCMAGLKKACAITNGKIGALDGQIVSAICQAAEELMDGRLQVSIPIDLVANGTPGNMSVNEIIANRANEILTGHKGNDLVHPNTHVNMGQSTNDVHPSGLKLALYLTIQELLPKINDLESILTYKAEQFKDVVKVGRTCLQDALPITIGQQFSGYQSFLHRQYQEIAQTAQELLVLPLGGTAIGTCVGTFPGYVEQVCDEVAAIFDLPVTQAENLFDAFQSADTFIRVSASLKSLATGLARMAKDLMFMSSGPQAGIGEITIPAIQPGSSIMPGKVNPVVFMAMVDIAHQVCGQDVTVTMQVEGEGDNLELQLYLNMASNALFQSCTMLQHFLPVLGSCISGIEANRERCQHEAEWSPAMATIISAIYGYPMGSKVAKEALREHKTVKQVTVEMGLLTADEAEQLLNPLAMAHYLEHMEAIFAKKKQVAIQA
ncbi:lyase family protein [Rubeoparvulum massiliense]|uniref:lyase family protein n=1 Tax=Rubeoparvulum massiliense TaxID=1631346 RepID=UPI00065DF310|nr:lyase family protein [Rubeoparvulum massiliense]